MTGLARRRCWLAGSPSTRTPSCSCWRRPRSRLARQLAALAGTRSTVRPCKRRPGEHVRTPCRPQSLAKRPLRLCGSWGAGRRVARLLQGCRGAWSPRGAGRRRWAGGDRRQTRRAGPCRRCRRCFRQRKGWRLGPPGRVQRASGRGGAPRSGDVAQRPAQRVQRMRMQGMRCARSRATWPRRARSCARWARRVCSPVRVSMPETGSGASLRHVPAVQQTSSYSLCIACRSGLQCVACAQRCVLCGCLLSIWE